MQSFVFITDTHFKASSNVRTGDFLQDTIDKLDFVIDYCNKTNSILLHGGDFFDSPSVPDMVKNKLILSLRNLKTKCYSLAGNHCLLYNNPDFSYKTSFQTLVNTGLVEALDDKTVDLGECIITNEKPIMSSDKPQIAMFHGLLNQDDGKYSFFFQDIQTTDKVYICLGHDHTEYENIKFNNSTIFRPGSFTRLSRQEESDRVPKMVHIICVDGTLKHKCILIKSRSSSEIFQTKLYHETAAQKHNNYQQLIEQLKNANATELSFEKALSTVAEPNVVDYITKLLTSYKLDNQVKRQNL